MEKELFAELLAIRAQADASIMSGIAVRNRDAFDVPYKTLQMYSELVLPYHYKKDKMVESAGIEDKDYWVKLLAERKKSLEQEEKK